MNSAAQSRYTSRLLAFSIGLMLLPWTAQANPEDFTIRSVTDTNVFKLSAAKGRFVALHFLLKTECPYCVRYTHEYLQKSAGQTNVVHVFLKPDTEDEIKAWAVKLGDDTRQTTIYRDPDAALAKAYGIPAGYKFHGQVVHFPALVLLDKQGKEVFRYVGKSNADRFTYEKLAAQLEKFTEPSPH